MIGSGRRLDARARCGGMAARIALAVAAVAAAPVAAQQGQPPAAPAAPPAAPEAEVVITARPGEAAVEAETEVDAVEIASYGADTVEQVIARLGALAGFGSAVGEEAPLILVNGEEVGFDRSILAYPAEALGRVAVLRPEAAGRYGQPAGRRVVNLVLKRKFASRDASVTGGGPTRGGQRSASVTLGQVAIDGPLRWNVQARLGMDSALSARDRDVVSAIGPLDRNGYIVAPDGGEIDPALSAAAGQGVAIAGVPVDRADRVPVLADFVATANRTSPRDPRDQETLLPLRRTASVQLGVTRPLGRFSVSINVNAGSSSSLGWRSAPMASLRLPGDSPWSPFAGDVLLVRPVADGRGLRQESRSDTFGASLAISARLGAWQTSFGASYGHGNSEGLYVRGADLAAIQAALDRGDVGFDPYAPLASPWLLTTRNRSSSDTLSARFSLSRPVLTLPAGSIALSLSGNGSISRSDSRNAVPPGPWEGAAAQRRSWGQGQVGLSVPISRRDPAGGGGGLAGDLTFDLTLGGQRASGSRGQTRLGAGLAWSPDPRVQLRATIDREDSVPSLDQLDAPTLETVRRVYDLVAQESADILWITGGNPALRSGMGQTVVLRLLLRPLNSQLLSVNLGYRARHNRDGIAPFPELTPAIEAAFPDRVVRDAAGRLIAVDARAINLARSDDVDLSWGVALRLPNPGSRPVPGAARAADPVRLGLTLNHRIKLANRIVIREGLAAIDQLRDGGQSRHMVSMQATLGKRAIGGELEAGWSSPARLRGTPGAGGSPDLLFRPPVRLGLGLFVEPGRILAGTRWPGALKDLRLSLDLDNLLDSYRRARFADGSIPPGYRRDAVDPIGRTIRLTARLRF